MNGDVVYCLTVRRAFSHGCPEWKSKRIDPWYKRAWLKVKQTLRIA
jgi:hypothetical protein